MPLHPDENGVRDSENIEMQLQKLTKKNSASLSNFQIIYVNGRNLNVDNTDVIAK